MKDKRFLIGGLIAFGVLILYERSKSTAAMSGTNSAMARLFGTNPAATSTGAQIGAAATGIGTLVTDVGSIFDKAPAVTSGVVVDSSGDFVSGGDSSDVGPAFGDLSGDLA